MSIGRLVAAGMLLGLGIATAILYARGAGAGIIVLGGIALFLGAFLVVDAEKDDDGDE